MKNVRSDEIEKRIKGKTAPGSRMQSIQGSEATAVPPFPPKIDKFRQKLVDFTFLLFTLHLFFVDFWQVISNSE